MEETNPQAVDLAPVINRGFAPVERNPARVYLAGLGTQTRQDVATKLARFATLMCFEDVRHVGWSQKRHEHVVALKTYLVERGGAPSPEAPD